MPSAFTGATIFRAIYLDLFKTVLTLGMIFAHVVQLADGTPGQIGHGLAQYFNLVTFSGFMLTFGMGIGSSRRTLSAGTMVTRCKTPFLLFVAYCVSSFTNLEFIGGQSIGSKEIFDVVLMRYLYGYSEFLASFFLLSIVTSFMRPLIFAICDNAYLIVASVVLSVVVSMIAPQAPEFPIIGTLVGSHDYATFPLVQYLPWFLLGVYYTRQDVHIDKMIWSIAVAATLAFVGYVLLYRSVPMRFPPHPLWIGGAAFPLLVYLSLSKAIAKLIQIPNWSVIPGRHVLFFLVTSNIVLFVANFLVAKQSMSFAGLLGYTVVLVISVALAWLIWNRASAAIPMPSRRIAQKA